MRKLLLLVVGLVAIVLIALLAAIVWIGSPRGPSLQEAGELLPLPVAAHDDHPQRRGLLQAAPHKLNTPKARQGQAG